MSSALGSLRPAMSLHLPRRSTLPLLTTLVGLGAFVVGVWSFVSPASAAKAFGGYMVRVLEAAGSSSQAVGNLSSAADPDHLAYVYPHGIRNLVQGLSILALTAYWQFSPRCRKCPPARMTAQRCLGIVIATGALTPLVDVWVNFRTAVPGSKADLDWNAAQVHLIRTLIWLVGGLWCLFG